MKIQKLLVLLLYRGHLPATLIICKSENSFITFTITNWLWHLTYAYACIVTTKTRLVYYNN